MKAVLWVAAGGALGAVLRYLVSIGVIVRPGHWPLSTLLVNLVGSALAGILYVLIVERGVMPAELRHLLIMGLIGAFTTFSTFALEAVQLIESGHGLAAAAYAVSSTLLCMGAVVAGLFLARLIP